MRREIKFEYGFKSVNGIVKKKYYLHQIPFIDKKCDVWNVLPIVYTRQFTGIKDKKGVEIYGGDILYRQYDKYEVIWNNCGWYLINVKDFHKKQFYFLHLFDFKETTVVGNIYENPEKL